MIRNRFNRIPLPSQDTRHANLYDKAQSIVLFNGTTELQSKSDKGVYSYKPSLTSYRERIKCEALDGHEDRVSIGWRLITNFRFADDIVVNAEEDKETEVLADRLHTDTTRYKIEIGLDKIKVIHDKQLKLLPKRDQDKRSAARSSGGPKPKTLSRTSQTTAALSRLKSICRDHVTNKAIRVESRMQLCIMFLAWWRHWHSDGTAVSQDPLAWRRHSAVTGARRREKQKKRWTITSRSGQKWSVDIPWGQQETGKGGKVLLQRHLRCCDDCQD